MSKTHLAAIGAAALALSLRVWLALHAPLWYDENFSAILARLDLSNLVRATAADVHPPLHYLVQWIVFHLAPGLDLEIKARLMSIVFSALTLWAWWRLLAVINLSQPVRLAAFVLFCVWPSEVYYGQEGRMYAQLQLLVMLQLYTLLTGRWRWFAVVTALALYTHNFGIIYTAVIVLIALVRELKRPLACYRPGIDPHISPELSAILTCVSLPVLAYLPWFMFATIPQARYLGSGSHWLVDLRPGGMIYSLIWIVIGSYNPQKAFLILQISSLAGLILALITAARRQLMLAVMAFLPWLLAAAGSLVVPMMLFRGFLPSVPFMLALGAAGIEQVYRQRKLSLAWLGCMICALIIVSGAWDTANTALAGKVHDDPLGYSRQQFEPGDLIVSMSDNELINFGSYAAPGVEVVLLDTGCHEQIAALGPVVRQAMGFRAITPEQLPHRYFLAGQVGALSYQCLVDAYDHYTSQARPIYELVLDEGRMGLYAYPPD